MAWPNPNPQFLAVKLLGPAERVRWRLYTPAWILVAQGEGGPYAQAGWQRLALPRDFGASAKGLYYFVVEAADAERRSPRIKGRLYRL